VFLIENVAVEVGVKSGA